VSLYEGAFYVGGVRCSQPLSGKRTATKVKREFAAEAVNVKTKTRALKRLKDAAL
jgi:hypothetical protein